MSDYRDYEGLLKEVDCADNECDAVMGFCKLVDDLIIDIKLLKLECITNRYKLSTYMAPEDGEMLKADILDYLGAGFWREDFAYDVYKELMYGGGDPMEFRQYQENIAKAKKGKYRWAGDFSKL